MRFSLPSSRRNRFNLLTALAVLFVFAALLVTTFARPHRELLWGDEGTYLAMTASLARDADLEFGETDAAWVNLRQPGPPVTVILQQTGRGVTYSKPILYPALSAPLYAALGEPGMVATQTATLLVALLLAWIFLRRLANGTRALWTLSTFIFCSVVLVYVSWKMSDLMLFSLTLAGLLLAMGGREIDADGRLVTLPFGSWPAAIVGGLLLGGTVSMRFTTAAIVAGAVLALVADLRWRRALVVGVMSLTAFLGISSLTVVLLGTANPYKAVRSSFDQESGYPAENTPSGTHERFRNRPATQSAGWPPPLDARRTAYSSLYFLIGRHTGILLYFPVALVVVAHLLRRPDRVSLSLLLGLAVVIGFYLIWMPQNYFGGSTFVGNRYFLGTLPVLIVALRCLPSARALGIAWVLAALAWSSAAYSMRTVGDLDRSSQSHAFGGIFRWLPAESTAQRIDGLEERFWADDYLRFHDPFAEPARWSFRLDSGRPAAEILVATHWVGEPLRFVIAPQTAPIEIDVSDWRSDETIVVPLELPAPPGLLEISVSKPWRRHAFWWRPGSLYNVRVLRFALRPVNEGETTAVIRYAGRGRELRPLAGTILNRKSLQPIAATAGQTSEIWLRVRNTGGRPWQPEGLFPHRLGYRLLSREHGTEVGNDTMILPRSVAPGHTLNVPMAIEWPRAPGVFNLLVEIRREPSDRLGSLGRSTLAELEVRVEPALSPDTREP